MISSAKHPNAAPYPFQMQPSSHFTLEQQQPSQSNASEYYTEFFPPASALAAVNQQRMIRAVTAVSVPSYNYSYPYYNCIPYYTTAQASTAPLSCTPATATTNATAMSTPSTSAHDGRLQNVHHMPLNHQAPPLNSSPLSPSCHPQLQEQIKTLNLCMEKSHRSRKHMLTIRKQFPLFLEQHPHLFPLYKEQFNNLMLKVIDQSKVSALNSVTWNSPCNSNSSSTSTKSSTSSSNTASHSRTSPTNLTHVHVHPNSMPVHYRNHPMGDKQQSFHRYCKHIMPMNHHQQQLYHPQRQPQLQQHHYPNQNIHPQMTPLSSNSSSGFTVPFSVSDEENIHPEELQRQKRLLLHTSHTHYPHHPNMASSDNTGWNTITDQRLNVLNAEFANHRVVEENESLKSQQSYVSEGNFSVPELCVAEIMASKMDCGDSSAKQRSEGGSSAFHHLLDICCSEVSFNSSKTNLNKGVETSGMTDGSSSGIKYLPTTSLPSFTTSSQLELQDRSSLKLKSSLLSPSSIQNAQVSLSNNHNHPKQSLTKRLSWNKFDDVDEDLVKKQNKVKFTKKTIRRRARLDNLSPDCDDVVVAARMEVDDSGSNDTKPESIRTLEVIKAVENIFENRSEVSYSVPSEDRWQPMRMDGGVR